MRFTVNEITKTLEVTGSIKISDLVDWCLEHEIDEDYYITVQSPIVAASYYPAPSWGNQPIARDIRSGYLDTASKIKGYVDQLVDTRPNKTLIKKSK